MGSLIVRKLIIISEAEKSSIEINFSEGLNIILGENKTGKSSLIKTIFYTFGCELEFDEKWQKLIKRSIVVFSSKGKNYILERNKRLYYLFETDLLFNNIKFKGSYSFSELSTQLMDLFDVNMTWLTKDGKEINVTPPHLFSFQYIDQDLGWHAIGGSFKSLSYIPKWKDQIIKFIVGYQDEEYFKIKKQIEEHKIAIKNLEIRLGNVEQFIENLFSKNITENQYAIVTNELDDDLTKTRKMIDELNVIEKERIVLKKKISELQNEHYESTLVVEALKKYSKDFSDDYAYAQELDEVINCPFCGVEHSNKIPDRSEIIKDIQVANNMISQNREEISSLNERISELQKNYIAKSRKYRLLRYKLKEIEEQASIINTYRNEGKKDILKQSQEEINEIKNEKLIEIGKREELISDLKSIESSSRKEEINKSIYNYLNIALKRLKLNDFDVKLRNFIPVLKSTGSEKPRLIYAYYVSLYLYNLNRENGKLKLLVIDTPNQQGQDKKNLENIYSMLDLLTSEKGQVILGSERVTGIEDRASEIIKLNEYKKCLSKDNYEKHNILFEILDSKIQEPLNIQA